VYTIFIGSLTPSKTKQMVDKKWGEINVSKSFYKKIVFCSCGVAGYKRRVISHFFRARASVYYICTMYENLGGPSPLSADAYASDGSHYFQGATIGK